jgi:hypothetical protein
MGAKHVIGLLLWGWLWGLGLQGMIMGAEQSNGEVVPERHASESKDDTPAIEPRASTLGNITKSSPEGPTKLEPDIAREAHKGESSGKVAVIIKVAEEGYVPPGVKVRAQIDPRIFTAEIDQEDIARLESDPRIVSMGTAKPLRPLEMQ